MAVGLHVNRLLGKTQNFSYYTPAITTEERLMI